MKQFNVEEFNKLVLNGHYKIKNPITVNEYMNKVENEIEALEKNIQTLNLKGDKKKKEVRKIETRQDTINFLLSLPSNLLIGSSWNNGQLLEVAIKFEYGLLPLPSPKKQVDIKYKGWKIEVKYFNPSPNGTTNLTSDLEKYIQDIQDEKRFTSYCYSNGKLYRLKKQLFLNLIDIAKIQKSNRSWKLKTSKIFHNFIQDVGTIKNIKGLEI